MIGISILFSLITSKEVHDVSKENNLENASKQNAPKMSKWFITTRYPLMIISLLLILF